MIKEEEFTKEKWIDGPWKQEPDRIEWKHNGMNCLAQRAPVTGSWCGYVGLPKSHPLYGFFYGECTIGCEPPRETDWEFLTKEAEEEGGTLRANVNRSFADLKKSRLLDNPPRCHSYNHSPEAVLDVHGGITYAASCEDNEVICHKAAPGEDDNLWWFGFDCAHSGDLSPKMNSLHRMIPELGTNWGNWLNDWEKYRDVNYIREETNHLAGQLKYMRFSFRFKPDMYIKDWFEREYFFRDDANCPDWLWALKPWHKEAERPTAPALL